MHSSLLAALEFELLENKYVLQFLMCYAIFDTDNCCIDAIVILLLFILKHLSR